MIVTAHVQELGRIDRVEDGAAGSTIGVDRGQSDRRGVQHTHGARGGRRVGVEGVEAHVVPVEHDGTSVVGHRGNVVVVRLASRYLRELVRRCRGLRRRRRDVVDDPVPCCLAIAREEHRATAGRIERLGIDAAPRAAIRQSRRRGLVAARGPEPGCLAVNLKDAAERVAVGPGRDEGEWPVGSRERGTRGRCGGERHTAGQGGQPGGTHGSLDSPPGGDTVDTARRGGHDAALQRVRPRLDSGSASELQFSRLVRSTCAARALRKGGATSGTRTHGCFEGSMRSAMRGVNEEAYAT